MTDLVILIISDSTMNGNRVYQLISSHPTVIANLDSYVTSRL